MDLIFCAGRNHKLEIIANEEGFLVGARSDYVGNNISYKFIDVNWLSFKEEPYINMIKRVRPKYAVVPDIMSEATAHDRINIGYRLQEYCEHVIIVPKTNSVVKNIPNEFIIGISIPTSYAGFLPDIELLEGKKVHLLGGSPKQQKEIWSKYCNLGIEIVSCDCNTHHKVSDFGKFWNGHIWEKVVLNEGKYEVFRRSCVGIRRMWRELGVKA